MKKPRAQGIHVVRIATWPQVRTIAVRAAAAACCVSEGTMRRWARGAAPASAGLYDGQMAQLGAEVLRLSDAIASHVSAGVAAPAGHPHTGRR